MGFLHRHDRATISLRLKMEGKSVWKSEKIKTESSRGVSEPYVSFGFFMGREINWEQSGTGT